MDPRKLSIIVSSMFFGLALSLPAQGGEGPTKKAGGKAREASKTRKANGGGVTVKELKIAVVDIVKATNAHPLATTKLAAFSEWRRREGARLQQMEKAWRTKGSELQITPPGTAKWKELNAEVQMLEFKLKLADRGFVNERNQRRAAMVLELRQQVAAAASELAKLKGIDLVLRKLVNDPKLPLRDQLSRSEAQVVLHASKAVDITGDVIDFMKTLYDTPKGPSK